MSFFQKCLFGAKSVFIVFCVTAFFGPSHIAAQVSLGYSAGYVTNMDSGEDAYRLDAVWPSTNNGNGEVIFCTGGSGLAHNFELSWEASQRFSISLAFRSARFTMPESKRTANINSLGLQLRVNFVSSDNKFIPFVRGEFMALNNSKLSQERATGINNQTQSDYSITTKTNLGLGADLGVEFALSSALYFQLTGGFHGVQLTNSEISVPAYTAPQAIKQPDNLNGTFFLQFAGGLKYYVSKRKKKRDF